jgi:hypothetical protein
VLLCGIYSIRDECETGGEEVLKINIRDDMRADAEQDEDFGGYDRGLCIIGGRREGMSYQAISWRATGLLPPSWSEERRTRTLQCVLYDAPVP